jgi:NAD(P)-dependent dehydrogenase (short-subunit alcohol dehydrogenase family)
VDLEGRVAIVSGIGPGMGRALALACATQGADVALAARRQEHLDPVAEEIRALGRRAITVPTDITEQGDCARLAERAVAELGRLDVLVNNAATEGRPMPIETADLAKRYRTPFEVNVFGTLQLVQAVIPAMKRAGSGSIVMISSHGYRVQPTRLRRDNSAYAASKAALFAATRSLALELGEYGIRVNTVVPSYIWGPNVKSYFEQLAREQGRTVEDFYDDMASGSALKRLATPEEISEAAAFFASDRARGITGQSLDVNCGSYFD